MKCVHKVKFALWFTLQGPDQILKISFRKNEASMLLNWELPKNHNPKTKIVIEIDYIQV